MLVAGFWTFAVLLGTANAIAGAYGDMRRDVATNNDFPMFYAGAVNVVSDDREHAYEKDFIVESIRGRWVDPESEKAQELIPWLRYYNPPFYLFAMSPLTALDLHVAYLVVVAVNVALMGLLLYLTGVLLRWRQPASLLVMITALGLMSVPQSIYQGQPTILIAVLTTGAFLLTQSGRSTAAAVLVAFAAAKPQYAVTAALPLLRARWRAVFPLAVAGFAVTLLPFLALGLGVLADYIDLVMGRGSDDLSNAEYSAHVLSWPGFLVGLTGSVQPFASVALTSISVGLFLLVLRQGDRYLTWSASILCALLILPHSHPQDWMLTVPAAAILLARPTSASLRNVTIGLLIAGYVAANTWVVASGVVYDGGRALYAVTPVTALLLAWLAVITLLERASGDKPAGLRLSEARQPPGRRLETL